MSIFVAGVYSRSISSFCHDYLYFIAGLHRQLQKLPQEFTIFCMHRQPVVWTITTPQWTIHFLTLVYCKLNHIAWVEVSDTDGVINNRGILKFCTGFFPCYSYTNCIGDITCRTTDFNPCMAIDFKLCTTENMRQDVYLPTLVTVELLETMQECVLTHWYYCYLLLFHSS